MSNSKNTSRSLYVEKVQDTKLPVWFNNENKNDTISDEEKAELEAMLKEFR